MNKRVVNNKNVKKGLVPYLFMILIMLGVFYVFNFMNTDIKKLTYNEFMSELSDGNIKDVTITARSSAKTYEVEGSLKDAKKIKHFLQDFQ